MLVAGVIVREPISSSSKASTYLIGRVLDCDNYAEGNWVRQSEECWSCFESKSPKPALMQPSDMRLSNRFSQVPADTLEYIAS